jgi:xanthine dehydrogenase accessory factor
VSDSVYDLLSSAIRAGEPVALATVIEGAEVGHKLLVGPGTARHGTLGTAGLDRVVARDAAAGLAAGSNAVRHYGPDGQAGEEAVSVFIESFAPAPRLLIIGAVDFTAALAAAAKLLGFDVIVCDAREVFATPRRFPMADEVVVDWPHRYLGALTAPLGGRDAVCVLTHDHKFDVPAIAAALDSDAGYVGAMGSRRTDEARRELLREEGLDDSLLDSLRSPIGLDIGARSPEETAVAICAEIISARTGRPGGPLRRARGPIH